MDFSDLYSGSAIGGAASGASAGGMIGGPWGAAIGGIGGGLLGAFASGQRRDATNAQQHNLDQIIANMHAMSASNYDQHIADLNKALAFYGPAQQYWDRLYGSGSPMPTGQGSWSGTGVK